MSWRVFFPQSAFPRGWAVIDTPLKVERHACHECVQRLGSHEGEG